MAQFVPWGRCCEGWEHAERDGWEKGLCPKLALSWWQWQPESDWKESEKGNETPRSVHQSGPELGDHIESLSPSVQLRPGTGKT
jgi:hypothetical protein